MSKPLKFKVKRIVGEEKVQAALMARLKILDAEAKKALTDEGNTVLQNAMSQCPVETGTLRRSGTVDEPRDTGKSVIVEVGFNTDYAAAVHENLKSHHSIGKAKFLEDPVNEAAPGMAARLAARLRI